MDDKVRADSAIPPSALVRVPGAQTTGVSLVELLIVLALVGVIAAIAIGTGTRTAAGQAEAAAVRAIQQSVWQGATAAAARGRETQLIITSRRLEVREVASGALVRADDLPEAIVTNLPNLVFSPPGRVRADSLASVPEDVFVRTSDSQFSLLVSAIGEVILERLP